MKVAHDEQSDSLTVIFNDSNSATESDEDKRGVILDCDRDGNLVSPEVLDASSRLTGARTTPLAALPPHSPCYVAPCQLLREL